MQSYQFNYYASFLNGLCKKYFLHKKYPKTKNLLFWGMVFYFNYNQILKVKKNVILR